jgi:HNH endonuclease
MPFCIYCLVDKKTSEFNVEHVLPRAFGTFEQNLTLIDKVCKNCNQLYGDKLEIAFARNTLAGVKRYKTGIKAPKEFRPSMAKFLTVMLDEQECDKLLLELAYSASHDDIVVAPKPIVGLKRKNGELEMFLLKDIPECEVLNREFALSDDESIYLPPGVDFEIVKQALKQRGVNFFLQRYRNAKIGNTVNCLITEDIGELTVRAIYKMAFNYLAKFNSTEAILHEMFDPSRAFILRGVHSKLVFCGFEYVPDEFINTLGNTHYHTMCITRTQGKILGHIYIHPAFRYIVLLAQDNEANNLKVDFGHMFDIASKAIVSFE